MAIHGDARIKSGHDGLVDYPNNWEDRAMAGNFTICVGTVGSGAWLSPDGGESWRRVAQGLGNESRVFGLSVHPTEPRTVFAGADDGLYKSSDGGQSFERLDSPMNRT